MAVASSIIGGTDIHIYVFTHQKKQSISKENNCAEHEYINISPLIIELATALHRRHNAILFSMFWDFMVQENVSFFSGNCMQKNYK